MLIIYTRPGCVGCETLKRNLPPDSYREVACEPDGGDGMVELLTLLSYYDLPVDNIAFPVLISADESVILMPMGPK